jgi:hypothetical protein
MLTPQNWYILEHNRVIYLCDGNELKTVVHTYLVKEMVLYVYDDIEEYRLEPKLHNTAHRWRSYDYTIDLCTCTMRRRAT